MKAIRLITIIVAFLLFYADGIQAQNTQTKLNQVLLFKQWIGNWKAEIGKDTTFVIECKSFHDGLDTYLKIETKGKILMDKKTLLGYDKKNDKCIEAIIENSSPELVLYECWFTSPNKAIEVLLEDIANPDKAKYKWTFELKSPDLLIWTDLINNKAVNTYTFQREK